MENCAVCCDNFIVSRKSITCKYCQKYFHPQCVGVKDAVQKMIQDAAGVFWFCATCIPVVGEKLAANLLPLPPDQNSASSEPGSHEVSTVQAGLQDVGQMLSSIISAKLDDMRRDDLLIGKQFLDRTDELKKEVQSLKDSNLDLIRLLDRGGSLPILFLVFGLLHPLLTDHHVLLEPMLLKLLLWRLSCYR